LDTDKEIRNQLLSTTNGEFNNNNFHSGLNVIRKLGNERGSLSYNLSYGLNRNASTEYLNADYDFSQSPDRSELQRQEIDQNSIGETIAMGLSSYIRVYPKVFLNTSYNFNSSSRYNERLAYDIATDDKSLVLDLSNAFESKSSKQTPSVGLVYEGEKLRINSSIGMVFNSLKNKEVFSNNLFENNFKNTYANLNVQLRPDQNNRLYLTYSNRTSTPSFNQQNPVVDNTDPLNIIVGNPDLNSSFSQNMSLQYTNSNLNKKSTFTCRASFGLTNDQVASKTTIDEDFIRTTTYTNVDGIGSGSLFLGYFKSVDKSSYNFK
jgi:outer membrane receptor protein involved in Fe transport